MNVSQYLSARKTVFIVIISKKVLNLIHKTSYIAFILKTNFHFKTQGLIYFQSY